jgi:ribosomal protein L12E/L44/L45/RPP1/RPP2
MNKKTIIALASMLAFGSVAVAQAADPPAAPAPSKDAPPPKDQPAPQKDEKKTDKPAEKKDDAKGAAPVGGNPK